MIAVKNIDVCLRGGSAGDVKWMDHEILSKYSFNNCLRFMMSSFVPIKNVVLSFITDMWMEMLFFLVISRLRES